MSNGLPSLPPDLFEDPVLARLLRGEAETLHEAEDLYLNASLPELYALAASDLSNDELAVHPLVQLLLSHGSRGWEDSVL